MLEMPGHSLIMRSLSGPFCASRWRFKGLFLAFRWIPVWDAHGPLPQKDASCLPPAGILSHSLRDVINPGESVTFSYSELRCLSNS